MTRLLFIGTLLGMLAFSISAIAAQAQWEDERAASGVVNAAFFTGICGDQNGDERLDVADALIDLQILVGVAEPTEFQQFLSDLNGTGTIDILDVMISLQHIVGSAPLRGCGP